MSTLRPGGRAVVPLVVTALVVTLVAALGSAAALSLLADPEDDPAEAEVSPQPAAWRLARAQLAPSPGDAEVTRTGRGTLVQAHQSGPLTLVHERGLRSSASPRDGTDWRLSTWVRSPRQQRVTVQVGPAGPAGQAGQPDSPVRRSDRWIPADRWVRVDTRVSTGDGPAALAPRLELRDSQAGDEVQIGRSTLRRVPATRRMDNGCALSPRGIPACGALLGAAHGSNTDPVGLEAFAGRSLGTRRTYWRADQVGDAVGTARRDLRAGRLPWLSFKLPDTWGSMDSPGGAAWARDVAEALADLPGPVWVAFHHEPEYDGDITAWRRMQERFIPVVRSAAPNVAYTVILTGYHQLYGEEHLRLDRVFPDGQVDLVAFDVYSSFGVVEDGTVNQATTDLVSGYFEPLADWARQRGVAWGIGETGYTDAAAARDPRWISATYDSLVRRGGVAFSYFDSTLNSSADWDLSNPVKREDFRAALLASPLFPTWRR